MNYHNGDIFHSVIGNVDDFLPFYIKEELLVTFSEDRKEDTNYPPLFRQDKIEIVLVLRGGKKKKGQK